MRDIEVKGVTGTLELARSPLEFRWMDFTTTDHGDGSVTISAQPKRWYALRPSFWVFAVKHWRLRPYEAQPIETED